MLNRNDQAERSAAAGRSRRFMGSNDVPAAAAAVVAAPGYVWTKSSVIPTTKRHALNPALRPEEAVSP